MPPTEFRFESLSPLFSLFRWSSQGSRGTLSCPPLPMTLKLPIEHHISEPFQGPQITCGQNLVLTTGAGPSESSIFTSISFLLGRSWLDIVHAHNTLVLLHEWRGVDVCLECEMRVGNADDCEYHDLIKWLYKPRVNNTLKLTSGTIKMMSAYVS